MDEVEAFMRRGGDILIEDGNPWDPREIYRGTARTHAVARWKQFSELGAPLKQGLLSGLSRTCRRRIAER
jgi:hypothetical protein